MSQRCNLMTTFISRSIHFLIILLACSSLSRAQSQVPSWVRDAVFYQIFPERFANGDTTNDPPGTKQWSWGAFPKHDSYYGGDIQGIIDHLDHLVRMGVTAVYFNPLFESPTNHKYHTADYYSIDDNFGTDSLFSFLVDECHKRNIKIVLDGVFNHTGVDFFAFKDVKEKGEKSPYVKWYNIHSFPVSDPDKPNYEGWWGLGSLPKLMTSNPEVQEYLIGVTRHWMKFGIDGWRLDAANEVPHEFWKKWRGVVKSMNPEAVIIGEVWNDASEWLQGDEFDAVTNYRFRGACVGFMALRNMKPSQFDSLLAAQRSDYSDEVNFSLLNILGSHDTERFMTLSKGDEFRLKAATIMQMTYLGAPMIYYGDEIGMKGEKDPDCRRTMIWDTTKWDIDLVNVYMKLIAIRHKYAALRRGDFKTAFVDDEKGIFAFWRTLGEDKVLVVLNNGDDFQLVPVPVLPDTSEYWFDVLNNRRYRSVKNTLGVVSVQGPWAAILVPEKNFKPKD